MTHSADYEVAADLKCRNNVVGGSTSTPLNIAGLPVDIAGDVTVGVSSLADLAGDVTVGVAPSADLAGDVTVGVSPPNNLTNNITIGVASSSNLAGDVTIGVTSSADRASVVTVGVAYREECGDNVVFPTDCVCACVEIAELAPSADLAGNVTIGVTSSADPAGVVTIGVAIREKCGDSFVIRSDSVCDYDYYLYDGQYDDCPDYYDYDDPDDYDSFHSVYGFVGPDYYELYHDLHGSDGCGIYCVARGIVDADVSYWSENRGPDVSHWSDNVRHDIQRGDVILSRTGSDVSPAVFEDSVVGTIGSGGPPVHRGSCRDSTRNGHRFGVSG